MSEADRQPKVIRCAIYTRKSTEEGLEQEFNSLHAQREACAAYISSQKHEGWVLTPGEYDDGGFSGGSMDRPGLRRILDEVHAGRVDVIVVYKVDRLTRHLGDFARIVDVLDQAKASFVSVTQAFNTTTSMGRLTLNVLLSFAQFEREVTGERIRDKIAASKAKGMWMGGTIPLGYDVVSRKLIINEDEAAVIRQIFSRYLELDSMLTLQAELEGDGVRSKSRANGRGGAILTRGALYFLLQNRLYVGEIGHKGKTYPGEHQPIVEQELFKQVQDRLEQNRTRSARRGRCRSLLAGLVWDSDGRRLSPTHTTKKTKRYRYYASPVGTEPTWRVPAGDLEEIVKTRLAELLGDDQAVHDAVNYSAPDAAALQHCLQMARDGRESLSLAAEGPVRRLIQRVEVHASRVDIHVKRDELASAGTTSREPLVLTAQAQLVRGPKDVRLMLSPSERAAAASRDPALIKLVVRGYAARKAVEQVTHPTVAAIADSRGYGVRHFRVLLRIGYLAPAIIEAILEGRQPPGLTREKLVRISDLPHNWTEQAERLGFAARKAS